MLTSLKSFFRIWIGNVLHLHINLERADIFVILKSFYPWIWYVSPFSLIFWSSLTFNKGKFLKNHFFINYFKLICDKKV
jgi:hypothetical protein